MDPIGTVTNYYPFLDEESRLIIDSLMKAAPNYLAFVDGLVDVVCTDDPTPALRYLGLIHVFDTTTQENLIRMRNAFKEDIVVNALTFWSGESVNTENNRKDFLRITDDALSTQPEEWITAIILLIGGGSLSPQVPKACKYIDQFKSIIESNEKLRFYESYLCLFQGRALREEGNIDGAIKEFERGIDNSKKHDHVHNEIYLLVALGATLKDRDTHAALEHIEYAYRLGKDLGDPEFTATTLQSLGLVYTILGEYDLALKAHHESLERNKLISDAPDVSVVLARLYCDLGKGEDALEWIQWGEPSVGDTVISTMWYLAKALSLIHLDRIEEAAVILDAAREMVFKSGSDWTMADYYYVQGNYYLATNNIDLALETLEKSLGISEPMGLQIFVNRCLIALTRAEIAQVGKTKESIDPESSGRWMSKLKTHAKNMNYPGIRMQHAILKAEYQIMLKDYESAKETLEVGLGIYDSPSVKCLMMVIQDKIDTLSKMV